MCLVTYFRSGDRTVITSNRDELSQRKAIAPDFIDFGNKKLIFPKDPQAGGTWFALDDNLNAAVLLNGAREKHQWNPPYRRSRGLILLEILSAESCFGHWNSIDLNAIEPFTIVLLEQNRLFQLRWDGQMKDAQEKDPGIAHIWSSSTLYSPQEIKLREGDFEQFISTSQSDCESLVEFHKRHLFTPNLTQRGSLSTTSITQFERAGERGIISYSDLASGRNVSKKISLRCV